MVTIIILNYNGWRDTIDCLESLSKQTYKELRIVVADNGSQDDSVRQITTWAKSHNPQLHILPLGENYGFAKGNNMAIQHMQSFPTDYFMCLNNDTILEPDCIEKLVAYANTHPEISSFIPEIRFFSQPDILWNAGGRLAFGGRRYYFASEPAKRLQGITELPVTFVTGCALLVHAKLVQEQPLFTERFFFGEEDYCFSLRMREEKRRMVCLPGAIIYHKVNASIDAFPSYNKLFIYLLNRIIDLRTYYPTYKYLAWITLYLPMIRLRFLKGLTCREKNHFLRLLMHEATHNDGVNRELFTHYINYRFQSQA